MSFWVAGAALVSAGLAMYNQHQTANAQNDDLAAGQIQQAQLNKQSNTATQKVISQFQNSTAQPYQAAALGKFNAALAANESNANAPLNQVGNTSAAYKQAAQAAATGISTYGQGNANLMSQIDAPQMQRQAETGDTLAYGSQIGQIQQNSKADAYLAQLKAQSEQPNPWIGGLSDVLGAYAKASAANGGTANAITAGDGQGIGSSVGSTPTSVGGGYTMNMPNFT